jgi:ubiquinone/menaquinone biosynthesis C-methylase UbiE
MTEKPSSSFQVDGNIAERYQRYTVPNLFVPWAEALVEAAGVRAGQAVLDVACGTGVVARTASRAAGRSGKVVGLDINAGMLEVARSVPVADGASISWVEADVANTGLDDDCFDVALCQQGIQYFPDKPAAARELYRVLSSGGRLLMSVWTGHNAYSAALASGVGHYVSEEWGHTMLAARTPPSLDELHAITEGAGFREVTIGTQELEERFPTAFIQQNLSAQPVSSAISNLTTEAQAALFSHIEQELSDYIRDGQIVTTNAIYLIAGWK